MMYNRLTILLKPLMTTFKDILQRYTTIPNSINKNTRQTNTAGMSQKQHLSSPAKSTVELYSRNQRPSLTNN